MHERKVACFISPPHVSSFPTGLRAFLTLKRAAHPSKFLAKPSRVRVHGAKAVVNCRRICIRRGSWQVVICTQWGLRYGGVDCKALGLLAASLCPPTYAQLLATVSTWRLRQGGKTPGDADEPKLTKSFLKPGRQDLQLKAITTAQRRWPTRPTELSSATQTTEAKDSSV